jgi:hypothetical protein
MSPLFGDLDTEISFFGSSVPTWPTTGCNSRVTGGLTRHSVRAEPRDLICFPEHALLIVEERLREQQAEEVRMPEGMPLDERALRSSSDTGSRETALRIAPENQTTL